MSSSSSSASLSSEGGSGVDGRTDGKKRKRIEEIESDGSHESISINQNNGGGGDRRDKGKGKRERKKKKKATTTPEKRKRKKKGEGAGKEPRGEEKEAAVSADEVAFINSHFEDGGVSKTKHGTTVAKKVCKVCTGKMPGKPMKRKHDGRVKGHSIFNLRRHLGKHGIVYGGGAQAGAEQQRPAVKKEGAQCKITEYGVFTPQQQEEVTQAIVLFCALDNRPHAVVEGRGFKLLMSKATRNRYNVPSRWTISRKCTIMAKQARKMTRTTIKADLEAAATFTMSFDAWKDSQRRHYLAVNLHWASPVSGQLHERCLAVREFPIPHTAAQTATVVKQVLSEFVVPEDHCLFAVTDNCSVMEACVRDHFPKGKRFYCVAHWLQLVISGALASSGAMEAVERVRAYVRKVLRRDKWWQQLAVHQQAEYKGREPLKLFLDGGVRWSAFFLMCERVAAVEEAIKKHMGEVMVAQRAGRELEKDSDEEGDGSMRMTENDLAVVRQLVHVLRPLFDATNVFQADSAKSPISVIIPQVIRLINRLKSGDLVVRPAKLKNGPQGELLTEKEAVVIGEADLHEPVKELRAALLADVRQRFGSGSRLDVQGLTAFYYAATFLDHRKRDLPSIGYANPTTCAATRDFMINTAARWMEWEERLRHMQQQQNHHHCQQQQQQDGGQRGGASGGGGWMMEHESEELTAEQAEYLEHAALAAATTVRVTGGSVVGQRQLLSLDDHKARAERELDRWMVHKVPFADLSIPPLVWWADEGMRRNFPYMSATARRLLSIPASSAGAERVFSQSGLTLSDLRQKMGTKTLEDLMVLKYQHSEGHVYLTPSEWAELELEEAAEA